MHTDTKSSCTLYTRTSQSIEDVSYSNELVLYTKLLAYTAKHTQIHRVSNAVNRYDIFNSVVCAWNGFYCLCVCVSGYWSWVYVCDFSRFVCVVNEFSVFSLYINGDLFASRWSVMRNIFYSSLLLRLVYVNIFLHRQLRACIHRTNWIIRLPNESHGAAFFIVRNFSLFCLLSLSRSHTHTNISQLTFIFRSCFDIFIIAVIVVVVVHFKWANDCYYC